MYRIGPLLLLLLAGGLAGCESDLPQGVTSYRPSAGMLTVLEERKAMHARELSSLPVERARDVPTLLDAARAMPNVMGLPAPTVAVPQVEQVVASGAAGALPARLYRPSVAKNTPAILFFCGGTWATGTLDGCEAASRQLASRTGWVVVSLRTRLAPEVRFPGEHDDALALYQWARAHLREWGADPTRVVLAGEGPGANLALSTALLVRDRAAQGSFVAAPEHLLLITPVAGTGLGSVSMLENRLAKPLSRPTVRWAQELYAPDDLRHPRIDLVRRPDLARLPPTTMILAQIDPLRSEAEELAARLQAAGVPTEARLFPGVTADFFALGGVVPEAAAAEAYAAARLQAAMARLAPAPVRPPLRRVRAHRRTR